MALIRSFIALTLSDEIKKSVQDWILTLRHHDTSIRWAGREQMHLTLKFLGDVEEQRFEQEFFPVFSQLLSPYMPISLSVEGVGQFPPRGSPRIFWVGLEGEMGPIRELVGQVDEFFERFGFPRERRPFNPHITLARLKSRPSSGMIKVWQESSKIQFGRCLVDRVIFYQSTLTKQGAVYSVIRSFNFGKSDSSTL